MRQLLAVLIVFAGVSCNGGDPEREISVKQTVGIVPGEDVLANDPIVVRKDTVGLLSELEPFDTLSHIEAIKTLKEIFDAFKEYEDGLDSDEHKKAVTRSLLSLNRVTDPDELTLLINVWQYYDPTDYTCRHLVVDVLKRDTAAAIEAVTYRINHKMNWESEEGTEFRGLLERIRE